MSICVFNCRLCSEHMGRSDCLNFGYQPLCNYFTNRKSEDIRRYSLTLAQCSKCGLVQLIEFPSAELIRPLHSWLRYNEPDEHIGSVALEFDKLLPKDWRTILSLGPFDFPLINKMGDTVRAYNVPLQKFVKKINGTFPYLEVYQDPINHYTLNYIETEVGAKVGAITFRYLLEHCKNPVLTLKALGSLIHPEGVLYIEIPDSQKFLSAKDYSFIWEEHLSYFTEKTFLRTARVAGFDVIKSLRFEGVLEDSLGFFLKSTSRRILNSPKLTYDEINTFLTYSTHFESYQKAYEANLLEITRSGKKVAIFGAGHQAIMFVNALNIGKYIDCAIDDDLNKRGYFFPGTFIPILSTEEAFNEKKIDVVLMAISPRSMTKVVDKIKSLCALKVDIYSIYQSESQLSIMGDNYGNC